MYKLKSLWQIIELVLYDWKWRRLIINPGDLEKAKVYLPHYAMKWCDYVNYNFDVNAEMMYVLGLLSLNVIE